MSEQPTELLTNAEQWRDHLQRHGLAAPAALDQLSAALADGRAGRLHQPPPSLLTVMLLGATGGGKSELLNALAGERIAVSHHRRPTTTAPSVYLHNDVPAARLYEYGAALAELSQAPGSLHRHNRDDLRNKVIIDAPDIDSYQTAHRETVMALLPMTDVALYVVTPFSYKDDLGWEMILRERGKRAFAFVLNKWDREGVPAGAGDGDEIGADLVHLAQERAGFAAPMVFFTSARTWATPPTERDTLPPLAPGENFEKLKQWLEQGLSTSQVEQIQRRRRRALWGALAAGVAGALPPQFDAEQANVAVERQTDALAAEGAALWRTATTHRAQALAQRREQEGRPHSPGPFGRLSGAVGALFNLGKTWRKVAEPAPDLTYDELTSTAERSTELILRHQSTAEWKLREQHVPLEGHAGLAEGEAERLGHDVQQHFEAESEAVFAAVTPRWRHATGWAILVIFELLTVGLLGLAAWRLVQAFIAGQYLDLKFTLNLFALVALLLMAGSALMAILFPPVESRVRRHLERALQHKWHAVAEAAAAPLRQRLDLLRQSRAQGQALMEQATAETDRLTKDIARADDPTTERLF